MKQVRWGIIGCGNVCEVKSGPAFYSVPGSELVAVMRRNADKARDYAERHSAQQWHTSVDDLIANPNINAIYIATPPSSHADIAIKALRSQHPVYVEKPMALTYKQCCSMIDAARQAQVPLYVAFYRREMEYFKKVGEVIASGLLGTILHINTRLITPPLQGDADGTLWHTQPHISGGGHFVDLAPHQLDLLIHWFGIPEEQSSRVENKAGRYEAEDFVELNLRFRNGIAYSGIWCFSAGEGANEDSFTIVGTHGTLHFSTFSMTPIVLQRTVRSEFVFKKPTTVQYNMIDKIVSELRNGQTELPPSTLEAAEVTRIIEQTLSHYYEHR